MDPGTIYSDDEVENYSSNDENDDIDEIEDYAREDFFDEFPDAVAGSKEFDFGDEGLSKLKKYIDEKGPRKKSINTLILGVRHSTRRGNVINLVDDANDLKDKEIIKDDVRVKSKEFVKKDKKLSKQMEKDAEEIEKEKEEMAFEEAPLAENISFLEMNLSVHLLRAIEDMKYENPTPIQATTIPIALRGRDICGCAATGTGKTAAFMLPILQRLMLKPTDRVVTRVLIVVPTRELGVQVFQVTKELSTYLSINTALAVGGLNLNTQQEELMENPDIIIATPGRLIDHIHNTPTFSLKDIEILVLDEADRMLDEFFVEQINEIVRQCSQSRQTMLFSATMTNAVKDLAVMSLKNPVRVFVNNNTDMAQNLRQEFILLNKSKENYRLAVLAYLLSTNFKEQCLVFVPKKQECHRLRIMFGLFGLKCGELHSNLKQHTRLMYLEDFKEKKVNVLFATDVAARGLDIKEVKTVINYTVPMSYQTYVHRVGRTARAGYSGRSITISKDHGSDYTLLRQIRKQSFSPIYERIVNDKCLTIFYNKIEKIDLKVEEVLKLEYMEKRAKASIDNALKEVVETKPKSSKEVTKLSDKILGKKRRRVRKERVSYVKGPKDIKTELERLEAVINGTRLYKEPVKKTKKEKQPPKPQEEESSAVKKKKRSKKRKTPAEDENGTDSKMASNFEKDLTAEDSSALKRMRRGPTFAELKEMAAERNRELNAPKKSKFQKNTKSSASNFNKENNLGKKKGFRK